MITNRFIFVHFPRTGGYNLQAMLKHLQFPDLEILEGSNHMPLSQARGLAPTWVPAWTIGCNPWGWYASWWKRCVEHHKLTGLSFPRFLSACLKADNEQIVPYRRLGRYTPCWHHFVDGPLDYICRLEDYYVEVHKVLKMYVPGLTSDQIDEALRKAGRERVSRDRTHYSKLYTPDMAEAVYIADQDLIEEFDYDFISGEEEFSLWEPYMMECLAG